MAEQLLDPDELHPDFECNLSDHQPDLQGLYRDTRKFVLSVSGSCNELLYHRHALTSVYTLSDKLRDAFCHIAIYSKHINLGINSGVLLDDDESAHCAIIDTLLDCAQRTARDAQLGISKLILRSVQIKVRAGHLPPPENNGTDYMKIPTNAL